MKSYDQDNRKDKEEPDGNSKKVKKNKMPKKEAKIFTKILLECEKKHAGRSYNEIYQIAKKEFDHWKSTQSRTQSEELAIKPTPITARMLFAPIVKPGSTETKEHIINHMENKETQAQWPKEKWKEENYPFIFESAGKEVRAILLRSKFLGHGSYGYTSKLEIQIGDITEKWVIKSQFFEVVPLKRIEHEAAILEKVGMLKGVRCGAKNMQIFMPYLGKAVGQFQEMDGNLNIIYNLNPHQRKTAILGLVKDVARLHALNIIHSDIGPHNLGLSTKNLTAQLFDFNLSKTVESHSKDVDGLSLTLAPEVQDRSPNSKASDAYSLGISMALLLEITYNEYKEIFHKEKVCPVALVINDKSLAIKKILELKFVSTSEAAEDVYQIIKNLTQINPSDRCTTDQALHDLTLALAKDPKPEIEPAKVESEKIVWKDVRWNKPEAKSSTGVTLKRLQTASKQNVVENEVNESVVNNLKEAQQRVKSATANLVTSVTLKKAQQRVESATASLVKTATLFAQKTSNKVESPLKPDVDKKAVTNNLPKFKK